MKRATAIRRRASPSRARWRGGRPVARAAASSIGAPGAAIEPLYSRIGARLFDTPRDGLSAADLGTPRLLEPLLRDAGLPVELAAGLDDAAVDDEVRTETEEALILTGRDVGTPILHFQPPGGTAFFGPVISRLPRPADAGPLWDHVIALAAYLQAK